MFDCGAESGMAVASLFDVSRDVDNVVPGGECFAVTYVKHNKRSENKMKRTGINSVRLRRFGSCVGHCRGV